MFRANCSQHYIIHRQSPGAGFWSNFFVILHGIEVADKKGWIPVVDMERHPNHYNEEIPVFNTLNSWEYYFKQPGRVSLDKALLLPHILQKDEEVGSFSRATVIVPQNERITKAKELIKKYIKVKKSILKEVDALIPLGLHFDILGVHVRGTDRRQGFENHLMTADAGTYLKEAKILDESYDFSQIFLACDEIETVGLFRKAFGDRLIVTEAYRVSQATDTKTGYGWLFTHIRPAHKYLLGREVLIDTLLLARAGHLLCGAFQCEPCRYLFRGREPGDSRGGLSGNVQKKE